MNWENRDGLYIFNNISAGEFYDSKFYWNEKDGTTRMHERVEKTKQSVMGYHRLSGRVHQTMLACFVFFNFLLYSIFFFWILVINKNFKIMKDVNIYIESLFGTNYENQFFYRYFEKWILFVSGEVKTVDLKNQNQMGHIPLSGRFQ